MVVVDMFTVNFYTDRAREENWSQSPAKTKRPPFKSRNQLLSVYGEAEDF